MSKRIKKRYNLLFAIHDMLLDDAFKDYKMTLNPDISENRKAKAFLTHYGRVIGSYKIECYEVGKEKPRFSYVEELVDMELIKYTLWKE